METFKNIFGWLAALVLFGFYNLYIFFNNTVVKVMRLK